MKLIELHILQSFPVTCLNRDDVGAPKSAFFGGCNRARVSSQCWKRAIRKMAAEAMPGTYAGERGHYFAERIEKAMIAESVEEAKAKESAKTIVDFLGSLDAKRKDVVKTSVALYLSPGEVSAIAKAAAVVLAKGEELDLKKGVFKKALEAVHPADAADIAIFGRMVASDHTLMLDGAGLFSHAISTHAVASEVDFFSAVDDIKPEDSEGAGHIGTLEFNAACYYRYIGINLDLLWDNDHLKHLAVAQRQAVLKAFLNAAALAVPTARKNSMFGANTPEFILGMRREKAQPLSLVNAFEAPVESRGGFVVPSQTALETHWKKMKDLYSLTTTVDKTLPPTKLDEMIASLVEGACG